MRSRGSLEFTAMANTPAEKSRIYTVSESTIYAWQGGQRTPGMVQRKRIHANGGPEPEAWNEPIPGDDVRPPPFDPDKVTPASPGATRRIADSTQAYAQELQHQIMSGGEPDPAKRIRQIRDLTDVIANLGKFTGDAILNKRQILMSPALRQIRDDLTLALEPWPEALAAAVGALTAEELT